MVREASTFADARMGAGLRACRLEHGEFWKVLMQPRKRSTGEEPMRKWREQRVAVIPPGRRRGEEGIGQGSAWLGCGRNAADRRISAYNTGIGGPQVR